MKPAPIFIISLLIIVSGCAVVKEPYFSTDYYSETKARVDSNDDTLKLLPASLRAGFARVSITPSLSMIGQNLPAKERVKMAGFGQLRQRFATGIHDSLFLKAVALSTGGKPVVVVSADMLLMPPNIVTKCEEILSGKGISRDQLFFSATHTHSGQGGWGYGLLARLMAGKQDERFEAFLTEKITGAVMSAISDMKTAAAGAGSFDAGQFIRNRLTGDPSHNNTAFDFIKIEQENGRSAVIGTFSAHSTTLGSKNTLLSADYPGYWARKIEESGYYMAMFCGGSMGGQSPSAEGENGFERAQAIGEGLADILTGQLKSKELSNPSVLASESIILSLPEYHMRLSGSINMTTGISRMLMPQPENVLVQALRLNDMVWFFVPGDFSGEYTLLMKKIMASRGYRSMITGYNGNYTGYILPGKYFWYDNYEPRTMGWFGPFFGDYVFEIMERIGNKLTP